MRRMSGDAIPTSPDDTAKPPTRQYYVYVIELYDDAGRRLNPDRPCVYVGQSACTPEERFRQHRSGYRAASKPHRYGRYLRRRLYERYNPIATRKEAEAMEVRLKVQLERQGYRVFGGH
jgi:hypothetical protein